MYWSALKDGILLDILRNVDKREYPAMKNITYGITAEEMKTKCKENENKTISKSRVVVCNTLEWRRVGTACKMVFKVERGPDPFIWSA